MKFQCSACDQSFKVDKSGAGTTIRCPNCQQPTTIPASFETVAQVPSRPVRWLWWAGGVAAMLLVAGVLAWLNHNKTIKQTEAVSIPSTPAPSPVPPPSSSTSANAPAIDPPTHLLVAADSADSKSKGRWVKELNTAVHDLQSIDDKDSVNFAAGMLASLNKPGGSSLGALNDDLRQIRDRVRLLVRQGAMESAACLNRAQVAATYRPNFAGPTQPNHRTGENVGPGGIVLYLPLNKPDENGFLRDESGSGNDAYVYGARWVPESRFGGAYQFCVTNFNDRIVVPNSESLNPGHITLAAWVKAPPSSGFWNRIFDKDCWHGYSLSLAGDDMRQRRKIRGTLQFEGQASCGVDPAPDENWHHVAATFDGQTARCYIDGVEHTSPVRNHGPLNKTDWDLCIGNSVVEYGTGELLAFDGLIAEVRIYNRALSAAEIKGLASRQE